MLKIINFCFIVAVVAFLANTVESLFLYNDIRAKDKPFGRRILSFASSIFTVEAVAWIRSIALGLAVGLLAIANSSFAIIFFYILVACLLIWWWIGGERFVEALAMSLLVLCLLSPGIKAATIAAGIAIGSPFWFSVIAALPFITIFAALFFIFFTLVFKAEDNLERWIVGAIAIVLAFIALVLFAGAIRWKDIGKTTAVSEEVEVIDITPAEEKIIEEDFEEEEEIPQVVEAESLEGLNYGTTDEGVWYDYREYNDREVDDKGKWTSPKTKYNAFGYDYSDLWFERPTEAQDLAVRKAISAQAENLPEALAFYSFDFFTKKEKEELGIKDLPVTSADSKKASIDTNFDGKGGGELQENLLLAFNNELYSDNVRLKFVTKTGNQKTAYIFHDDADKDGEVIPSEAICCYDTAKRNNSKQVEVQRFFPYSNGKGGEWKTVLILNMDCGFQPCWEKVPRGVPKKPSDPPTPAPTPTPKPQPKPDPKKDPTQGTQGEVVKPNDDKTPGPNTNNPTNPTESKVEETPNSTDYKTPQQVQQETKELEQINETQKEAGDPNTPTAPAPAGTTNIDSNATTGTGNGGIDVPTPVIPPATTGGNPIVNSGDVTCTQEIPVPQ